MAEKTGISWTDATVTPIRARNLETGKVGWHCEHASEGCRNCYSETQNVIARGPGTGLPFAPTFRKGVELFLDSDHLTRPLGWKNPKRIFWCSMTDLFADFVPDEWIDQCFAVFALAPQHTFQVLTKRADRMRDWVSRTKAGDLSEIGMKLALDKFGPVLGGRWDEYWKERNGAGVRAAFQQWPLPNVWLGVSVEDQPNADHRIPELLRTPAERRFVSYEPALGPVDFTQIHYRGVMKDVRPGEDLPYDVTINAVTGDAHDGEDVCGDRAARLHQIIVGAESGASRRPFEISWLESVARQVDGTGCALYVKQGSDRYPGRQGRIPEVLWGRKEFPA